jgi:hypothetical protein
MPETVFGVGEAARRANVRPQVLTNLFYRGVLDGRVCPVVAGRRVIPAEYLPVLLSVVRERLGRPHPAQEAPPC